MNITPEVRTALLEGREYGFESAVRAPKHFADRLVEIRAALVEKRSIPQPSAAYQTRSLAAGLFARDLFKTCRPKSMEQRFFDTYGRWPTAVRTALPVRKVNNLKPAPMSPAKLADLSRRSGVSVGTLQTIEQRSRASVLAAEIAKDRKDEKRSREVAVSNLNASDLRAAFDRQMGWSK